MILIIKDKIVNIVGKSNVFDDDKTILSYASSANGTLLLPQIIVFPEHDSQIQELVRLANEENLSLYSISTGRN